jgi:hypothetical protein
MLDLVEGWTEPLNYTLKADGAAVNLTGMTVVLMLYDNRYNVVTQTGVVSVPSATTGQVRYSPGVGELLSSRSPYNLRWKVTDTASKITFFPIGDMEQWLVRLP